MCPPTPRRQGVPITRVDDDGIRILCIDPAIKWQGFPDAPYEEDSFSE